METRTIEGQTISIYRLIAEDPSLKHCVGAMVNGTVLIRSERIESMKNCQDLLEQAQYVHNQLNFDDQKFPVRISSMQLNTLDEEWKYIQTQQRYLGAAIKGSEGKFQIAHLAFPTELTYFKYNSRAQSDFIQKAIIKLLSQCNVEAWLVYCEWFSYEVKRRLDALHPEDAEEYPLQARFDDFLHEVNSVLLRNVRRDVSEATINQMTAIESNDDARLFALEKTIVAGREKLKVLLKTQLGVLQQIIEGIKAIEESHSELKDLKLTATILYELLSSQLDVSKGWMQELILIQLLDEQLGVVSCVNCDSGIERTNYVFAVRLAIAELRRELPMEEFLMLIREWKSPNFVENALYKRLSSLVLENKKAFDVAGKETKELPGFRLNKNLREFLENTN